MNERFVGNRHHLWKLGRKSRTHWISLKVRLLLLLFITTDIPPGWLKTSARFSYTRNPLSVLFCTAPWKTSSAVPQCTCRRVLYSTGRQLVSHLSPQQTRIGPSGFYCLFPCPSDARLEKNRPLFPKSPNICSRIFFLHAVSVSLVIRKIPHFCRRGINYFHYPYL